MVLDGGKRQYKVVREVFSGEKNDVFVCMDLCLEGAEYKTAWRVKDREITKKLLGAPEIWEDSFVKKEHMYFVFPYREERPMEKFYFTTVMANSLKEESIWLDFAVRCMTFGIPNEILYLLLKQKQAGITPEIRPVVARANELAEITGEPGMAIQLADGAVVDGKTSELMGCSAAALLNALKSLSGAGGHGVHLIAQAAIEPIQTVKVSYLGSANPRLHSDETLIALSISAATNPTAELAMQQLDKLRGCEAHSSVILSQVDVAVFKKLGMNLTYEPQYQTKKLYHK